MGWDDEYNDPEQQRRRDVDAQEGWECHRCGSPPDNWRDLRNGWCKHCKGWKRFLLTIGIPEDGSQVHRRGWGPNPRAAMEYLQHEDWQDIRRENLQLAQRMPLSKPWILISHTVLEQ